MCHATPPRIIPARAGPTHALSWRRGHGADHPRSCGANVCWTVPMSVPIGSSPLVRGQQTCGTRPRKRQRIIPARAGPTWPRCGTRPRRPDHPRSCGANQAIRVVVISGNGSSPLVRGQLGLVFYRYVALRIIPARAGPTLFIAAAPMVVPDHPRSCGANGVTAPSP